jgi:hypothetical protein
MYQHQLDVQTVTSEAKKAEELKLGGCVYEHTGVKDTRQVTLNGEANGTMTMITFGEGTRFYKAMNKNVRYNSHIGYTWLSNFTTASNYTPLIYNDNSPSGVFSYETVISQKFLLIDNDTLQSLWYAIYDAQILLTDQAVIDIMKENGYEFNGAFRGADVIKFAFYRTADGNPGIGRYSVSLVDREFVSIIHSFLNTTYGVSIDGYYAPPLPAWGGGVFHEEVATLNGDLNFIRKIDDPLDFVYPYFITNKYNFLDPPEYYWIRLVSGAGIFDDEVYIVSHISHTFDIDYSYNWSKFYNWISTATDTSGNLYPGEKIYSLHAYGSNISRFNLKKSIASGGVTHKKSYISFYHNFMKDVYTHIFNTTYYSQAHTITTEDGIVVNRPNHGSAHFLRKVWTSLHMTTLARTTHPELFNIITRDGNINNILALAMSPVFVRMLRIDEDATLLGFKDEKAWAALFPILYSYGIYEDLFGIDTTVSPSQIAVCFILKTILKKLVTNDDEIIEIYTLCMILYSKKDSYMDRVYRAYEGKQEDVTVSFNSNLVARKEKLKYQIIITYGLIMTPHYMDHCRGAFSEGLDEVFVKFSMKVFNIDYEQRMNIISKSIGNILKTGEYTTWRGMNIESYETNQVHIRSCIAMSNLHAPKVSSYKTCCQEFDRSTRFTSPLFGKCSTDFNFCYTTLGIDTELENLIDTIL